MPLDPQVNARDGYLLLSTAARLVQRRLDEALAPLGLTRAAVIALQAVSPHPGPRAGPSGGGRPDHEDTKPP
jgi:hypothetical protein